MKNKIKVSTIRNFLVKHKVIIILIIILILGALLRLYNFENRWGLAYDQARDVIVSRYALQTLQIPLIGPFSSAGQFIYGPQWYWLIMLFSLPYLPSFLTPWIVLNIINTGLIIVFYFIGRKAINNSVGLILALFAAVSPAQISLSINLISPAMVGITAALTVLVFLYYINNKRLLFGFLFGFLIANSINIHFQAMGLMALIPVSMAIVFFPEFRKKEKKHTKKLILMLSSHIGVIVLGLIIPFIPLFIFDLKTRFYETRGLLDYYLYGQYRIYVPNRWLTYIGEFWPLAWSRIIGGYIYISIGLMLLSVIAPIWWAIKKRNLKNYYALVVSFLLMFLILRYYRGERYDNYINFLHSFILVFAAGSVYFLYKINKILAVLAVGIIVFGSLKMAVPEIINARNTASEEAKQWTYELLKKYPNSKFALYDYRWRYPYRGYAINLYLMDRNKLSDGGMKIGTAAQESKSKMKSDFARIIYRDGLELYNLSSSTSAQLEKDKWYFINPSQVYHSVEKWYEDK